MAYGGKNADFHAAQLAAQERELARSASLGAGDNSPDNATGLNHIYIIDVDDANRLELHNIMSRRSNAAVRTYRNAADFMQSYEDGVDGGCIIIASGNEPQDALKLLQRLRRDSRFSCIVISTLNDVAAAVDAMKAGAADYLIQPFSTATLDKVVDDSVGELRQYRAKAEATQRARGRISRLSAREQDVLDGLMLGNSNKMIAQHLDISPRTVEIYRAHLMEKLGVHSLSEVLKIGFCGSCAFVGPQNRNSGF